MVPQISAFSGSLWMSRKPVSANELVVITAGEFGNGCKNPLPEAPAARRMLSMLVRSASWPSVAGGPMRDHLNPDFHRNFEPTTTAPDMSLTLPAFAPPAASNSGTRTTSGPLFNVDVCFAKIAPPSDALTALLSRATSARAPNGAAHRTRLLPTFDQTRTAQSAWLGAGCISTNPGSRRTPTVGRKVKKMNIVHGWTSTLAGGRQALVVLGLPPGRCSLTTAADE